MKRTGCTIRTAVLLSPKYRNQLTDILKQTMTSEKPLATFTQDQLGILTNSAAMAEELVSNAYKMSTNQWLRRRYDFKTLVDLSPDEIVFGPFAQIIRYEGKKQNTTLGSANYDFYKICLQDHSILSVLGQQSNLGLFPFSLYIATHELIHIVRFSKFLCNFMAPSEKKILEEALVHKKTRSILSNVNVLDLDIVLQFFENWHIPLDKLGNL